MKKLIFDVKYDDEKGLAKVAALEFENFTEKVETNYYTQDCNVYSEYIPGEFYKGNCQPLCY
jgi:deoxyinosine 3'endonuclease (endonuclease V)